MDFSQVVNKYGNVGTADCDPKIKRVLTEIEEKTEFLFSLVEQIESPKEKILALRIMAHHLISTVETIGSERILLAQHKMRKNENR